jgi:hypothetical protein
VDLWKAPPAAWARARWLADAYRGLCARRDPSELGGEESASAPLPARLSVTGDLEPLMQCPFRFFAAKLLKLEPLPEAAEGISHVDRGSLVHAILATFVAEMKADVRWPGDLAWCRGRLEAAVESAFDTASPGWRLSPFWRVERLRLLGDEEFQGLLSAWLEAERGRTAEGWRFAASEAAFDDVLLEAAGVRLKGRVDRVDHAPARGFAVWDYKTGAPPAARDALRGIYPQLRAYAEALCQGALEGLEPPPLGTLVQGGYIPLQRPGDVEIKPLDTGGRDAVTVDLASRREEWDGFVAQRLEGPKAGRWPADPLPSPGPGRDQGACTYCPFENLCGYWDAPDREAESEVEP